MNTELKAKIDEVAEAIQALSGMRESKTYNVKGGRTFIYEPTARQTYHGTYLNPFMVACRKKDEPYLWSDVIAEEKAVISINPLYRHNGTKEDVNVEISVCHWHSQVGEYPITKSYDAHVDAEVRRVVAEQSPTDYVKMDKIVCSVSCGRIVFRAKVLATAKERAIHNAVGKAMAAVLSFEPRDHSALAKRREDYHADTRAEHDAWVVGQREKQVHDLQKGIQ